jgi:DNA-binding transcriptional ArsR family regulator
MKYMKCVQPERSPEFVDDLRKQYEFAPALDELAELLGVYANPTRLKIVSMLSEHGELCVCDLAGALGTSVSAASQHLAKLRAHRLVRFRRDAQTLYYSLTDHPLHERLVGAIQDARAVDGE